MKENKRITEWLINSNLGEEEIETVKRAAEEIMESIKNNKLSFYQAMQALELTKAVIGEANFI